MRIEKKTIIGIILGIITVAAICLFIFMGSVTVDIKEAYVTIGGTLADDITVIYDDIDTVELVENVDVGLKTVGTETLRTKTGQYRSEEYGAYSLFMYKSVSNGIVLTTKTGDIIIFNCDTPEKTAECCNAINDKLLKPEEEPIPEEPTEQPESLVDET